MTMEMACKPVFLSVPVMLLWQSTCWPFYGYVTPQCLLWGLHSHIATVCVLSELTTRLIEQVTDHLAVDGVRANHG